jgi:hypothetical protein
MMSAAASSSGRHQREPSKNTRSSAPVRPRNLAGTRAVGMNSASPSCRYSMYAVWRGTTRWSPATAASIVT